MVWRHRGLSHSRLFHTIEAFNSGQIKYNCSIQKNTNPRQRNCQTFSNRDISDYYSEPDGKGHYES